MFNDRPDYNSPAYKAWRYGVLRRDHWTCVICHTKGGELEAHHIKKWAEFERLRYVNANGVTLCKKCHGTVNGREEIYEDQFAKIVARAKIAEEETKGLNKKTKTTKDKFKAMFKWRPLNPRLRM